jgi:hypothetical protein
MQMDIAENQEKLVENKPERDEKGRLLPGNTANPNGRPLKSDAWATLYDEALSAQDINCTYTVLVRERDREGHYTGNWVEVERKIQCDAGEKSTIRRLIVLQKITLAISGDLDAMKDIEDRERGKPKQAIDHTTGGEKIKGYTVLAHPDMWDNSEKEKNESNTTNSNTVNGSIS